MKARELFDKIFFSKLNPDYFEPLVMTIAQSDSSKYGNIERIKMKVKDTQSLSQKYKEMKRSLATIENTLKGFTNNCEKFKNLIIWSEPRRSMIAFIILFLLMVVMSKITFRFAFNAIIIFKFVDCRKFYKVARKHNNFIALCVLEDFLEDNYPDLTSSVLENKDFPTNNSTFCKKVIFGILNIKLAL